MKTDKIDRDDAVIPEGYSALLIGPDGFDLSIPKEDADGNIPDEAAFLCGVAMRMKSDEAWVHDMFDWLNNSVEKDEEDSAS